MEMLGNFDQTANLKDEKIVETMIGDPTQLAFTPKNFSNIIHILARV